MRCLGSVLKTFSLCTILLVGGTQAQDNKYGDLISIPDLGQKFEETGDTSYLYTATVRCAAVYAAMSSILSNLGQYETSAGFDRAMTNLLTIAPTISTANWDSEPTEEDMNFQQESVAQGFVQYTELLGARIQNNYLATGKHFGGDDLLNDEIPYCQRVMNLSAPFFEGMEDD